MRIFHTFIATEPVAKGRPRVTRMGHAYTPSATVQAEHRIQEQVAKEWSTVALDGPLAVSIVVQLLKPKSAPKRRVIWPTSRPDADNYGKLVLDALNGILWRDDSRVVDLRIQKVYSDHLGIDLEVFLVKAPIDAASALQLCEVP